MSDTNSEMTPPLPKKLLKGILKSSSAGSLKVNSPLLVKKTFDEKKEDCVENTTNSINNSIGIKNKTIQKEESPEKLKRNNTKEDRGKYGKKIPKELLKQAISMPNTPIQTSMNNPFDETPPPSDSRTMKLKKAKEQFLASGSNAMRDTTRQRNIDLVGNR